jgi:penicillin-binding protein 1A
MQDVRRTPAQVRGRSTRRRASLKKRIKTVIALLLLTLLTVVAMGLVGFLVIFYQFSKQELPNIEVVVADVKAPTATQILSEDGVVLGKLDVENRAPVNLKDLPKHLLNATIAIEDHRFYEHPGVDIIGIGRAAVANFQSNRASQGGSTLTQQVVRNLSQFNAIGITREKKLSRKIREAFIAIRMEQVYSKDEILRLYLNNVFYGGGAYGVQAASRTYFGKSAHKLNLAEAALIAGLAQRPSATSPFVNKDAAVARRDEVLDKMQEYGYITAEQNAKAKSEKPLFMPRRTRKGYNFRAPHFVTYILQDLYSRYGEEFVHSGLTIRTTLNYKMQKAAEKALYEGLARSPANQGAIVALDNRTGYIRAMVGGRSFVADQFNAVTQGKRQPGSTFKVFVYTAGFDTDTTSLTKGYVDEPIRYPNDPRRRVVKNYGGGYSHRWTSCLNAIQFSKNTIAVACAKDVGINTVIEYAQKMGITTKLYPVLPTALGASEVRPLDLCSSYSVFPMKGSRCLPMGLVKVTDQDNNIIEEHSPRIQHEILKPRTVEQMDKALSLVVTAGTGTRARSGPGGVLEDARGKTGTTNDNRDAWFAGYTPELTCVIWVANVRKTRAGSLQYNVMPGTTGGGVCAPMWNRFMTQAVPIQKGFKYRGVAAITVDTLPTPPVEETPREERRRRRETIATPAVATDEPAEMDAPSAEEQNAVNATTNNQGNGDDTGSLSSPTTPTPRATPVPEPPPTRPPAAQQSNPNESGLLPNMGSPNRTARENPGTSSPSGRVRSGMPSTALTPTAPETVAVRVCVDSGNKANDYCPAYQTTRVSPAQARRMRVCRQHRQPLN